MGRVDSSRLRVSDDDRERGAKTIREHYAAGRLSDEELDERLQAVYAARTAGELAAAQADLPALPATVAQRGAHGQFWPGWVLLVVLVPLLRNGWRMYGPAPDLDTVEAELERRERHARRHDRRARRHARRD